MASKLGILFSSVPVRRKPSALLDPTGCSTQITIFIVLVYIFQPMKFTSLIPYSSASAFIQTQANLSVYLIIHRCRFYTGHNSPYPIDCLNYFLSAGIDSLLLNTMEINLMMGRLKRPTTFKLFAELFLSWKKWF